MSLKAIDRKKTILELLNEHGKVKTIDLVKAIGVSSESVRRYLDELESENKLRKVYGGAIKINNVMEEPEHVKRNNININEKKKIAKLAATFVEDNDCIVIDEGTTCLQIVEHIVDRKNLTVVTSSCTVLVELIRYKNMGVFNGEIVFIGGKINAKHERASGEIAIDVMKNIFVDKAFISVEGLLDTFGISSADESKALLSREYVKNSRESIVLCDSSKIGMASTYKIADFCYINMVVSEEDMPEELVTIFEKFGVKWVVSE